MKSFLLNSDNKPIIRWGLLKDNTFFEGPIPEGYCLAISPSSDMVIVDVDCKNNKNGFEHIPDNILEELSLTFNYKTKSGGRHFWIKYTGSEILKNTSTIYGLDLRIGPKDGNCGGYVKYHHTEDIRNCTDKIKPSSVNLNTWLISLFA